MTEADFAGDKFPIVKLKPELLLPLVRALQGVTKRTDAVVRTVAVFEAEAGWIFPEGRDSETAEKRTFRALASPALTRLHLARSVPPNYWLTPAARIVGLLESPNAYLGLHLRDLLSVRLGFSDSYGQPEALAKVGRGNARSLDRLGGIRRMLTAFPLEYHPKPNTVPFVRNDGILDVPRTDVVDYLLRNTRDVVATSSPITLDLARWNGLQLLSKKFGWTTMFSFDDVLKHWIHESRAIEPLVGGGTPLAQITYKGNPVYALRRVG